MTEFMEKISKEEWELYIQLATIAISIITLITVFVKMSYMKNQLLELRKSFDFERFKELSLLLASDVQAIRVAGVLSLKELILENTRYYSPVVDTYMSYLNEKLRTPEPSAADIVVQKIIHVLGDEELGDIKFIDPHLSRNNHFKIATKTFLSLNTKSNLGDEPRQRIYERRARLHQLEYSLIFSKLTIESYNFSNRFYYASKFIRSKLVDVRFIRSYLESVAFIESEFHSVSFKNANLERAVFRDCTFSNVCFDGAFLKEVKFINCTFDEGSYPDKGRDFSLSAVVDEK